MSLLFEKKKGIALVGMNRPEALNALDAGILQELDEAWIEVDKDKEIRVAVLYSALENMFCAGMDLKTVIPILTAARPPQTDSEKWLVQNPQGIYRSMLREKKWDKPVVAAIDRKSVV